MNDRSFDPFVSVIVCTLDKPAQLANALRSIQEQSYPRHAVVVVDDYSELWANNRAICNRYPGAILYHRNQTKQGIAATRNLGVRLAIQHFSPDLITMLDDDDVWPTDRLIAGVRAMTTAVGMSYGAQQMSDCELRPMFKFPCKVSYRRVLLHAALFGEFFFPAKTYMFRVDFLQEIRLGPTQWYCDHDAREDIELGVRALQHAHENPRWTITYIDRMLAHWIQPVDLQKFCTDEYKRKQMAAHADFVQQYLPPAVRKLATATAPLTFALPHWLKYRFV